MRPKCYFAATLAESNDCQKKVTQNSKNINQMKKALILVCLLLLLSVSAQAQLLPSLRLGAGGGFSGSSQTTTVLGRDITTTYAGFNLGGKFKATIPLVPLTPMVFVNYSSFSLTTENVTSDIRSTMLAYGIGAELVILPLPVISPYVGVDVGLYSASSTAQNATTTTRTGVGVGLGAEISVPLVPIAFEVEGKYRLSNLLGRQEGERAFNYFQVSAMVMLKIL
ncbi:MAG: outer membrane beta-barrel protein [Chloroherpetonaceae bacterium]|nr:outer membrane beta-barrel protein [Chloroherpetonaceae bacterium]